ncbi:MAG: protein translocase SEC61 complex subunit gamma [Nanoarchaeota archaeon]|nr:protein translocase SEC61 complex subunit gamma [Nanoarchaeota archaeon]
MAKAKQFGTECLRVLRITKKPNREEFSAVVKVSALGILVIGLLGFVIIMISRFIRG